MNSDIEAMLEDAYARMEELEAEADQRQTALSDYIDDEETEINSMRYEALALHTKIKDMEKSYK